MMGSTECWNPDLYPYSSLDGHIVYYMHFILFEKKPREVFVSGSCPELGVIKIVFIYGLRLLCDIYFLVLFTILFIQQLKKGGEKFRQTDSSASQYSKRVSENRRISFNPVRLITELQYYIFLLLSA